MYADDKAQRRFRVSSCALVILAAIVAVRRGIRINSDQEKDAL